MDASVFLQKVRELRPLVHHITNWVTIYDCANIVKALGAAPVMAHAPQEAAEMTSLAKGLVLNLGTLTEDLVETMKLSAQAANKKEIPVVLDVCGAGSTLFRDQKSLELLDQVKIDVLKGNASEIARLAGEKVRTKGVDSGFVEKDTADLAFALAEKRNCLVIVTGETDIIAGPRKRFKVYNGHELMSRVVGTGCMAASVVGTFCAVSNDLAEAAACGLSCLGIAAEMAGQSSAGPGTFKVHLIDCIYGLKPEAVRQKQRIG